MLRSIEVWLVTMLAVTIPAIAMWALFSLAYWLGI